MRVRMLMAVMVLATIVGAATNVRSVGASPQEGKALAATAALNLNAATTADLEKLPGVGPAMAAKILEYRQKSGGFKKIEDLMNIKGIGEKNFLKLKPLVTVTPSKAAER